VLFRSQTHAGIVNMLRSGDPAEAIANVVTTVMVQLDKKSNGRVPETVILPAAAELVGEVAQLAGKIGLQVDERVVGQAMQRMLVTLADEYGVSEQEIQELMQSVGPDQAKQYATQQSGFNQTAQPAEQPAAPAAQPAAPMGA